MNCGRAQLALSARMDGEHLDRSVALDEHVAACERCRAFVSSAERVRAAVRIRAAEPVPDLVTRIVDELEIASDRVTASRRTALRGSDRWRRAMPVAAALVAGAIVGSVLVGGPLRGTDPSGVSAAAVIHGIRGASPDLQAFDGRFEVVERGLAPRVPLRRLDVRIAFLAPQRYRLDVVDRTAYPSASWTPSDVTYIEDAATTYRSGPTGCPEGLDAVCPTTRTTVTTRSTPSDLVVPMTTFGSTDGVRVLGTHRIDGHEVVRVALTFDRAAPMLPFLRLDATWRPFFRGDRVEVSLDTEAWLPRRIAVFPAATGARRAWELRFGLPPESATVPILEVVATSIETRPPDPSVFEIPGVTPQHLSVADLAERVGYRPATPTFTGDLELSTSIAPPIGRSGPRSVLLYSDGLDFLRIGERPRSHDRSAFGLLGPGVTPIVLPGGGIASFAAATETGTRRIAIRGDDTTLVLDSNLPLPELVRIAGSIPIRGRPSP